MKRNSEKSSPESPDWSDKDWPEVQEYGGEMDSKARRARNIIIAVAILFSLMPGIIFLIVTFFR